MTCEFFTDSPDAILLTLWWHFTQKFRLKWSLEHYNLLWGDVVLKRSSTGVEFLEFKPQNGKMPDVDPKLRPKLFAIPGTLNILYTSSLKHNFID